MRNKVIGVTGLSGSGKTTVTRILTETGAFAVIADELAHEAILSGNPPYDLVIKEFGPDILMEESKEIDRKKLSGVVFGNKERLKVLEDIIHPYVIEATLKLTDEADRSGKYSLTVIDAPMLVEAGMHKSCDEVWLISAPDELKIERIAARDGISRETAAKRLSVRNEDSLKKYADVIILNGGSMDSLREEVLRHGTVTV